MVDDSPNPKKYVFDIALALIILLSIALIFLQNEKGQLTGVLKTFDESIIIFFIVEYIARFYIATNFRKDISNKGLLFALRRKLKWIFKISSLIDLLALIPSLNFFRAFRTLRFLRLFRLIRLFRVFKIFRDIDKLNIILQGMKEQNRIFYVFFFLTISLLTLLSFVIFISEGGKTNTDFATFSDTFWYTLKTIELVDDTPKSFIGRFFTMILLVFNLAIFGFFISLFLTKIQTVMNAITSGKITSLNLKNHIVICGYTKSSKNVIEDLLKDVKNYNNIVLISCKEVEEISGVIYVNADFTDYSALRKVNIKSAKFAVVFAESREHDTIRDTDLRTVMTIFHIEKEAPNVHTIAEINDEINAEIIKDKMKGDEILYKELIDSKIITTCINNPNISDMFYDLFGNDNDRIKTIDFESLKMNNKATVKLVKHFFVERGEIFLGLIDNNKQSIISPKNDLVVDASYRVIYLS
ncbi:ion transporter [Psychroserpens algicola]|uniref:BK channel n=1 Tax=Psychroserpens algicola TaxID=1719034 RepID=A0ABT0H975_9FLAO|nr:ion transporter [Psychroserpens algicola]MCK8480911.1 ion transporter [Psychroserpens algicola]